MSPKFTHSVYKIQIDEDYPLTGAQELRLIQFTHPILAVDQDADFKSEINYQITGGNEMKYFQIDKKTGELYLTKELDREMLETDKFYLDIVAWQTNNDLKEDTAAIEITVMDINDNKPEFDVEKYNMTVIENLPAGFRIMQFTAQDKDQPDNARFHYTLEDPSGAFILKPDGSLVLDKPEHFDREKHENIIVRVLAVEDSPSVLSDTTPSSVEVEIHLLDFNDNSPTFVPNNVYEFVVPKTAALGDLVGKVTASDVDQGSNAFISYSIKNQTEPLPIRLDQTTGQIFLTDIYAQADK